MTTTTSINNITINTIVDPTIRVIVDAKRISGIIKDVVKKSVNNCNTDIEELTRDCLLELGIETYREGCWSDVWEDKLFVHDFDRDGGVYRTWVGNFFVKQVHTWDFSGKEMDEADLVSWGDVHYGYQGRVLAKEVCIEDLIEVHKTVCGLIPELMKFFTKERKESAKYWGRNMNHQLEEAGCTKSEIQAWWNMQWKKEWSPIQWKVFCTSHSDETISAALAAHSHAYLEAVGVSLGRSFPRTMDAVEALGKSRKLSPKRVVHWDKKEGGISPSEVKRDGSRSWSF